MIDQIRFKIIILNEYRNILIIVIDIQHQQLLT